MPPDGGVVAAPPYQLLRPTPPPSAADRAQAGQAARIDQLERTFSHPRVLAVVEGVVTAAEASVQTTPNAGYPTMIATRYTIDVTRSWKSEVPKTIAIWAYGGFLPEDVSPDYRPRGMRDSGEAYLQVGQHVMVAAADSYTLPSSPPKWHTLNGEGGTLMVGAKPDIDSAIRDSLNAKFPSFFIDEPPRADPAGLIYNYQINDTWCAHSALDVVMNVQSFVDRGFDRYTADAAIRTAMTWWNDSQTYLKFRIDGYTTTETSSNDPGPISAACCTKKNGCEDTKFLDHTGWVAYTHTDFGYTGCELFGVRITGFKVVVNANFPTGDNNLCGDTPVWKTEFNDSIGSADLFRVIGHEFGHALGMDHDSSFTDALMWGTEGDSQYFSHQEVQGQIAMYGTEHGNLQTVLAHEDPNNPGKLIFNPIQALSSPSILARWKPVIDANNFPGAASDYVIAWNENGTIHVATANDDTNGHLVVGTIHDTGFYTENGFGMAVGPDNTIGLAFLHPLTRKVEFGFSTNGGTSWTLHGPNPGVYARGGVDLTYSWWGWVMTWIDRYSQKIVTANSGYYDPQTISWQPPRTYTGGTVDLVSPNMEPAIDCERYICLMVYRTYDDGEIHTVRQQIFDATPSGLDAVPTSVGTGAWALTNLDIERAQSIGYGAWIFTNVVPSTYQDDLSYHISTGPSYSSHAVYGPSSRSGFDVANNEDGDTIRFLWHGR